MSREALETKPVAWASSLDFDDDDQEIIPAKDKGKLGTSNCDIPLYTAPKQWVWLTDDEIEEIQKSLGIAIHRSDFRAIEAEIRRKNT